MAVTSLSANKLRKLLAELQADYPDLRFKPDSREHWSPGDKTVYYSDSENLATSIFGLLHELGHALMAHHDYSDDFELLRLETEAWGLAVQIGRKYGVAIPDEHIQNCLDTYRDWLHQRSLCPACGSKGIQDQISDYKCLNCSTAWKVGANRFNRTYRQSNRSKKQKPA